MLYRRTVYTRRVYLATALLTWRVHLQRDGTTIITDTYFIIDRCSSRNTLYLLANDYLRQHHVILLLLFYRPSNIFLPDIPDARPRSIDVVFWFYNWYVVSTWLVKNQKSYWRIRISELVYYYHVYFSKYSHTNERQWVLTTAQYSA